MKIRRPGEGPPPNRGRPPAISAIIEKKQAQYIPLDCGHLTTWEEDMSYAAWREQRHKGKYFCDKCGQWRPLKPKPKRPPLPQEPLF